MATIKVSTQVLRSTANEFKTIGAQIKSLTTEMTNEVSNISGDVWQGDAATKYKAQFRKLDDDIALMIKMINEHVSDLNDMAAAYEKAEQANETAASSLATDIIS
ncbi:WXG100 family type VII secretion target [Butyribacter sp.]|uniref:WXG100 family type VII secretion target n=1 Tax=Butyribacter sp. TaxID=2822465 RepID=UPI002A93AA84|nr:WXG100 family type VII secretion target [Butyribacter sp.]